MNIGQKWLCCVVLGLAGSLPASAAVMVSNLEEATFSSFPVGFWWAGNQFVTDASAPAFTLESVVLLVDDASATPGNFFVSIYSHASDRPGVELARLSGSANPATAGQYAYTSAGLNLQPSTSYWIVAGVESGGAAGSGYPWKLANSGSGATGPWTIPATDTHITSFSDGGANWNNLQNDGFPRQFSVSASPVPEPSSWALGGLGGLMLLLCARKRRGVPSSS